MEIERDFDYGVCEIGGVDGEIRVCIHNFAEICSLQVK